VKVSLIADVVSFRGRSSTRHLLFQSTNWDLDVFLSKEDGTVSLTGQIMPRDSVAISDVFNAVAVLVEKETFVETTNVSASGEFQFRSIPDSELQLELFLNSIHLSVGFKP
jgi:hypothetical protein